MTHGMEDSYGTTISTTTHVMGAGQIGPDRAGLTDHRTCCLVLVGSVLQVGPCRGLRARGVAATCKGWSVALVVALGHSCARSTRQIERSDRQSEQVHITEYTQSFCFTRPPPPQRPSRSVPLDPKKQRLQPTTTSTPAPPQNQTNKQTWSRLLARLEVLRGDACAVRYGTRSEGWQKVEVSDRGRSDGGTGRAAFAAQ